MRHTLLLIVFGLAMATGLRSQAEEPITVGVAEVDYQDSSGEPKDQQAAHAARAQRFAEALRQDLGARGTYRIVTLDCGKDPCSVGSQIPEDLIAAAKRAGARLLVYGGVHKMSTLVQNMRAAAVDVETDKLVFERLITFRGDDDAAWDRAERFLAKEFLEEKLAQ